MTLWVSFSPNDCMRPNSAAAAIVRQFILGNQLSPNSLPLLYANLRELCLDPTRHELYLLEISSHWYWPGLERWILAFSLLFLSQPRHPILLDINFGYRICCRLFTSYQLLNPPFKSQHTSCVSPMSSSRRRPPTSPNQPLERRSAFHVFRRRLDTSHSGLSTGDSTTSTNNSPNPVSTKV